MQPFHHFRINTVDEAVQLANEAHQRGQAVRYLAGGTTLVDLMRLEVLNSLVVIDLGNLRTSNVAPVRVHDGRLRLNAFASMAEVARDSVVRRHAPVIVESLEQAASQQIRNMASLGGNLLQETRCPYYRDTAWEACNRRDPGSGCAALVGANRQHALLGGNNTCVATYPGDLAQALIALDAQLTIHGPTGQRQLAVADLYGVDPYPGKPQLQSAELISAIHLPVGAHTRRSCYVKVRDRSSFAFALASAAVALRLDRDRVSEVRIALGGVASMPWRASRAEQFLIGKRLNEAVAQAAGRMAFAGSRPLSNNGFKVELGIQTLTRALLQAQAMEV